MSCLLVSCGEDTEEESEFVNWQARNEAFFASLQDSLNSNPAQWKRIKCYSLDHTTEGNATDYVYAKVIESGTGTEVPLFTDSVRVIYRGRLIPSASYSQGYVFDETVYGTYSSATGATKCFWLASTGLISGFTTVLQHMHRGDYWRVYIPSELGYGETENSTAGIPGYSVLIFDLTLVDFSPVGQTMPIWRARRQ